MFFTTERVMEGSVDSKEQARTELVKDFKSFERNKDHSLKGRKIDFSSGHKLRIAHNHNNSNVSRRYDTVTDEEEDDSLAEAYNSKTDQKEF